MGISISNLSYGFSEPLFSGLSLSFETGWTAVTGANGAGKTTLLNLITGDLQSEQGSVRITGSYVYCRQLTPEPPEEAEPLFSDESPAAYRIRSRFGLRREWLGSWKKLSFGEQKRVQTASALYLSPDNLILDEPSNHLDLEGRRMLLNALKNFRGTGIIVSHDRGFLNELADRTLFLEPPHYELRIQNYSAAAAEREKERNYLEQQKKNKTGELRRLRKRAAEYRNLASNADRKNSKRNIDAADHDAKARMDAARLQGKDAMHGRMMNRLQGRIAKETERLEAMGTAKKRTSINFSLRFTPDRHGTLFYIDGGVLNLGSKNLSYGPLEMKSTERAALTGPNGSGKTSLLNLIFGACRMQSTLYLRQEISSSEEEQLFSRLNALNSSDKGRIYSIMAALGSPPERVLLAETPSPGEIRKLIIAEAITKNIGFLILDEPTNHLDLPSIEALEESLAEYGAGLLLVSHDRVFLENTTEKCWKIRDNGQDCCILEI